MTSEPSDSLGLPEEPAAPTWQGQGRRKRITARELSPVEVEQVESEMLAAAEGIIQPSDVIDIPTLRPGEPEAIIDPTQFSERHRRQGDNRSYRLTQIAVGLSLAASCGAFLGTLMDRRLRALVIAGFASVCAGVAVKLVRSSRLARRLRGYVVAACALALISAAACFFLPNFHDRNDTDEKKPVPVTH